jgi:hypothetical protein
MLENSVLVSSIPDISSNNFKLEDMLLKSNEIINFDFNTFLVILNACDAVLSNTKRRAKLDFLSCTLALLLTFKTPASLA